jgi:NADPH:quinone reductase-like Zn-dependent oxidoreductase
LINLLNMPPLSVGAVVLVTGASGFIGTHVVRALDQAGFWVRATVRSKEKGEYLKTLVSGIEVVVVPDMSAVSARGERLWDDFPAAPWDGTVMSSHLPSPFSILHPLHLSPPPHPS